MAMIVTLALMLSTSISAVSADQAKANPLGKVLELLRSLEVKIIREQNEEAKAFDEFFQWCDKASQNLNFEIKTYKNMKEKQEAKIAELKSDIEVAVSKIEDLSQTVAMSEAELNKAARIRSKESADFAAGEKELVETIDTLSRAIGIVSTEMSKNPAALAQIDSTSISTLMQSLSLVVDAAGVSSADQQKLLALVQSRQGDEELSAPASATYKSQSGGIVDVLEDLKDKADAELSDARKTETNSKNNFGMMKQSLEDQMAADTKDLNEEKAAKEDAEDEKAKMEGDLAITIPDLKDDTASLETFHQDCMQSAADHEATMAARKGEQTVIAKAKTILLEASYGALDKDDDRCECIPRSCGTGTYTPEIISRKSVQRQWGAWCFTRGNCNSMNQESVVDCPGNYWARLPEGAFEPKAASMLQLASTSRATMHTRADLANSEVVALVKKLAREQHSAALAQLASRIAVVTKYGGRDGADPFGKIKGLISEMIDKLEKEAESEATEKSYCDEQVAKTEAKKAELNFDIEKLLTKIDQAVARSAELKDESKVLHEEAALVSETVAELHNLRSESHANYLSSTADIEKGLAAVQKALGLLRDYYGTKETSMIQESMIPAGSGAFLEQPAKPEQHAKASGSGGSVIGILEVIESDFANGLSKVETEEADAEAEYQKILQEKKVIKATQDSDLKYKKRELVSLEKSISELTSDKENFDSELSAVLQYYARVKERCIASPDTYEAKVARREAEIGGLKEALSIIESEAAFLQKKKRMRGGSAMLQ